MQGFDSLPRLIDRWIFEPKDNFMEGERKSEPKDESGFSERQLDVNIETGIFRSKKTKLKKTKILFEKKSKK